KGISGAVSDGRKVEPVTHTGPVIADLYEKAVNLYKGDFLSGQQDSTWSASLRENIKDEFILLCYKAGEFYESIKEWDKGIECYKTVSGIDNLREDSYRRMMSCNIKAGLNGEALAVYNRCNNMLHLAHSAGPSREMEALRHRVMENGNF
ncbi:MAG: hypothetical protein HQK94_17785, partial [Nitrospirae bacterium]|nr:hypothetical protein [Nitrospirota bacterium]